MSAPNEQNHFRYYNLFPVKADDETTLSIIILVQLVLRMKIFLGITLLKLVLKIKIYLSITIFMA